MHPRLTRGRASLLGLILLISTGVPIVTLRADPQNTPPRDWSAHPAIVELQTSEDIYALGDVHGDDKKMAQLLAAAKLIESAPDNPADIKWTGGKAVLVITGDYIDKGKHSIEVLTMLRTLQPQAQSAGGHVILTMGNHEAEFLASHGAVNVTTEFTAEIRSAGISPAAVAAGVDAEGIGQFLRDLPLAAKVNDWFLCHAGNTHGLSLDQLRQQLMTEIDAKGFAADIVANPDSLLEARMHPNPWWEESGGTEQTLRDSIASLGCKHLVFGHQPGKVDFADGTHRPRDQMFTMFVGLVFLIDMGMSRGVDDAPGALLRIAKDPAHSELLTATALFADGSMKTLWSQQ